MIGIALAVGEAYPTYSWNHQDKLDATVTLKALDRVTIVVIQTGGQETARVVNQKGEPLRKHRPLLTMVVTPGPHRFAMQSQVEGELAADADFVANLDRLNYSSMLCTH